MPDSSKETKSAETSKRLELLRSQIAQPGPTASDTQQATTPAAPTSEPSPLAQARQPAGSAWKGLGQPSSHDRRSQVPFEARYKKENIMIDRRLLAAYYDLMSKLGRSKVEAFNAMLLQVLLDADYQIDPKILERPFQWEDLPR